MSDPIRGSSTPVFIGGTFVKRAQSFEASKIQDVVNVIDQGSGNYVGPIISPAEYTARLQVLEVGQGVLGLLGVTTSWLTYIASDPAGVTIGCISSGLTGAVVKSLELILGVGQAAEESFALAGTGWTTVATASPAPDMSLLPIMGSDCFCNMGPTIQRVTLRAGADLRFVRELDNTTIVGKVYSQPYAEVQIECIHPGTCTWVADETAAVYITVVADIVQFVVDSCVSVEEPHKGNIRGWTTNIYKYRSTTGEVTFS